MARGDFKLFDNVCLLIGTTKYDLANDTLKMGIITSAATPVATQADPKWGTYSANEVTTNAAYAAGGPALSSVAFTASSNVATLDSSAITISQNSSGSAACFWGILYDDTHSSDAALGFVDLGGPVDQTAGDITITPNASGWLTITVTT
ncbi:MAG: hypothetical protein HKM94_11250 [Halobacteria archaeon]|nr:hypothetical protein [Halobacteria archaeon]